MKHLPVYMVPSAFVLLDSFPLTSNGKINRQALPEPELGRTSPEENYVAPTSLTHYQLVQIWEELLDVRPIGIRDNFFYLGGHSFLAARLINRIEEVFGQRLSLSTLFANPTIEQLASALQEQKAGQEKEAGGPWVPLRKIQPKGTKRPFFFLHGDYLGEAFYTFTLAHFLGMDQPFYALEPFPFDILPPTTLEDIAKAYIQVLQTVQPQGPYLLGGFCSGALVAYEIARQLQAQGERIDALVLIDPANPAPLHTVARKAFDFIAKVLHSNSDKQLEWFLRLRHVCKCLLHQRRPEDIEEIGVVDPSIHRLIPTREALRQDNIGIITWIVAGYNYPFYPGKITLLWAREELFRGTWRRKIEKDNNFRLDFTPGTHVTCRTDYILDLAEKLKIALSSPRDTDHYVVNASLIEEKIL